MYLLQNRIMIMYSIPIIFRICRVTAIKYSNIQVHNIIIIYAVDTMIDV